MKTQLIIMITIIMMTSIPLCISATAGDSADYWYTRALGLAGDGHYKEAVNAFDSSLQLDSNNAGAWAGKASALGSLALSEKNKDDLNESLKEYDKAVALYDDAINKDSQDANSWYNKGIAFKNRAFIMQSGVGIGLKADENAVARYINDSFNAFDKATHISPNFMAAWRNKGNILYIMGRYNDSIKAHDKAIEIDPKYMLAWYNKGLSLYEMGKYQDAVQAYDNATKIGPEDADIWFNCGKALAGEGNYDAAINAYNKALNLKPSFAAVWYYKGIAFKNLGLDTVSQAAFSKANSMGYANKSKALDVNFDT